MTVYVLTQKVGSASWPVGTTSSAQKATEWLRMANGNDLFRFELDSLDHLGFRDCSEPQSPVQLDLSVPLPPRADLNADPAEALRELSSYLNALGDDMERITKAVQA